MKDQRFYVLWAVLTVPVSLSFYYEGGVSFFLSIFFGAAFVLCAVPIMVMLFIVMVNNMGEREDKTLNYAVYAITSILIMINLYIGGTATMGGSFMLGSFVGAIIHPVVLMAIYLIIAGYSHLYEKLS